MRRPILAVLVVTPALVGCGEDSGTATVPAKAETAPTVAKRARQVVVRATDFKLSPAVVSGGSEGLVSIRIVNDGKSPHALAVEGPNGLIELDGRLEPGASATLEADLDKPGTYAMYCPLDGHRAKGMSGSITVGGDAPARGAEPSGGSTATTATPTQTATQTQTTTQTETETKTVTTPSQTHTESTPTATTGQPSGDGY